MTGREEILTEAAAIVTQDRATDYGTPENNFGKIAELWSAYLEIPVQAHDVASMMILLKLARVTSSPKKMDHWVDIAGYAACGGEVA